MSTAAVLFTGGKDSIYALHVAHKDGFDIRVLVSVIPLYRYSMIYHQPFFHGLVSQAQSLQIPLETIGVYNQDEEVSALRFILKKARDKYHVRTIISGAVKSLFQYKLFNKISDELGLVHLAPNWGLDEKSYMLNILNNGVEFIIISI
ncbi:MAG: ATP-binding protein, partial [Desulfurococcaceae archaeon]